MMYAYGTRKTISREPQKVRYHRQVELPEGMLTLDDIAKHLQEGETFVFTEEQTSQFGTTLYMNIYGSRPETQEEIEARVAKEEKYNENYDKFHAKYGR